MAELTHIKTSEYHDLLLQIGRIDGACEMLIAERDRLRAERDAKDKQLASCYERMVRAEARISALGDTLIEIYNCYDKGGNLSEEAYVAIDAARANLKEGKKSD